MQLRIAMQPRPRPNLRCNQKQKYHDAKINKHHNIQLIHQPTNLKLILPLIHHKLWLHASVNHHRIHIIRILDECTPRNKLLKIQRCLYIFQVVLPQALQLTVKLVDVFARLYVVKREYLLSNFCLCQMLLQFALYHPGCKFWLEISLAVKLRSVDEALPVGVVSLQDYAICGDERVMVENNHISNLEMLRFSFRDFNVSGLCLVHSLDFIIIDLPITAPPPQIRHQFKKDAHENDPADGYGTCQGRVCGDLRYRLEYCIANEEWIYNTLQLLKQCQGKKIKDIVLRWANFVCGSWPRPIRNGCSGRLCRAPSNWQIHSLHVRNTWSLWLQSIIFQICHKWTIAYWLISNLIILYKFNN